MELFALVLFLVVLTTLHPLASNLSAIAEPIKPEDPVTNTLKKSIFQNFWIHFWTGMEEMYPKKSLTLFIYIQTIVLFFWAERTFKARVGVWEISGTYGREKILDGRKWWGTIGEYSIDTQTKKRKKAIRRRNSKGISIFVNLQK